jgi:hypothetical protein
MNGTKMTVINVSDVLFFWKVNFNLGTQWILLAQKSLIVNLKPNN